MVQREWLSTAPRRERSTLHGATDHNGAARPRRSGARSRSTARHGAPVVLRTAGLKKQYGRVTAVQDVSIAVQQGDVFGFLGPNGSGKTTTVAMILGLIEPTAGNVELFGQTTPEGRYSALDKVGSIIESPAFYPFLSGRDNLHVVARLRNVPKARVGQVLDQVYPRGSGGPEIQRLLARHEAAAGDRRGAPQ